MTIPDYVSPIIGHRVWQWDGSALVSLNGEHWPSGCGLEATCNIPGKRISDFGRLFQQGNHKAPQSNCSCGIYATKNSGQLSYFRFRMYGICGEVYLWGTVIEHSLGWRAQFAYPKSLVLPTDMISSIDESKSMLDALATYGADISLADGETTSPLWTKRSGYEKGALDLLRSVANRPGRTQVRVRPMSFRGFPPSGGSTPPMAPVFAPVNRGPRPMRPTAVALVI